MIGTSRSWGTLRNSRTIETASGKSVCEWMTTSRGFLLRGTADVPGEDPPNVAPWSSRRRRSARRQDRRVAMRMRAEPIAPQAVSRGRTSLSSN